MFLKFKVIFTKENREATVFERFFSGSAAGVMSQSMIYPLEVNYIASFLGKYTQFLFAWNRLYLFCFVLLCMRKASQNEDGASKNR